RRSAADKFPIVAIGQRAAAGAVLVDNDGAALSVLDVGRIAKRAVAAKRKRKIEARRKVDRNRGGVGQRDEVGGGRDVVMFETTKGRVGAIFRGGRKLDGAIVRCSRLALLDARTEGVPGAAVIRQNE